MPRVKQYPCYTVYIHVSQLSELVQSDCAIYVARMANKEKSPDLLLFGLLGANF